MAGISNRKSDLGNEGQVKMVPLPSLIFFFLILAVLGCLSELLELQCASLVALWCIES